MKILVISAEMPFPPIGGGRLRTYHWLRALAAEHELTLIAFTFDDEDNGTPRFPVEVVPIPWTPPPLYRAMESQDSTVAQHAFEVLDGEIAEPWYASYFDSPAAEEAIHAQIERGVDLVVFEDSDMGRFISLVPDEIPKVLDLHNVYSVMARRAARDAERTLSYERSVAASCDLCLACSESEAAAVHDLLGVESVEVLPNGVDTSFFVPSTQEPDTGALLFTGSMNYAPNIEAVTYFVREILPRILRARPDVVLHVVGKEPPDELKALHSDHVIIHGRVPDVRPHFARASVVVAPILSGGGTRFKILEAAACGRAIVTTSLGTEGLAFRADEDLVVADSAAEFALLVVRLLDDRERRIRLGRAARSGSLQYDWSTLATKLRDLVDQVGSSRPAFSR